MRYERLFSVQDLIWRLSLLKASYMFVRCRASQRWRLNNRNLLTSIKTRENPLITLENNECVVEEKHLWTPKQRLYWLTPKQRGVMHVQDYRMFVDATHEFNDYYDSEGNTGIMTVLDFSACIRFPCTQTWRNMVKKLYFSIRFESAMKCICTCNIFNMPSKSMLSALHVSKNLSTQTMLMLTHPRNAFASASPSREPPP